MVGWSGRRCLVGVFFDEVVEVDTDESSAEKDNIKDPFMYFYHVKVENKALNEKLLIYM